MGLFSRKPKAVKEIYGGLWGHMVRDHNVSVDILGKEMRCVDKPGTVDGMPATLVRIFRPADAQAKGIEVTGWETLDQHPELVLYEGYLNAKNQAHLTVRDGRKPA